MQQAVTITKNILEVLDDPVEHKWEKLGLGKAPFHVVGLLSLPSASIAEKNPDYYRYLMQEFEEGRKAWKLKEMGSCQACYTAIQNHYIIKSSDGKTFVVGSECVKKTYDDGLVKGVKEFDRKQKLAAEKFKPKSDKQLFYSEKNKAWSNTELKIVAIQKKIKDIKKDHYEWMASILDTLRGGFAESYAEKLRTDFGVTFEGVSDKVYNIFADIYAKYESNGSTRNSKAYKSAEEAFHKKAEDTDNAFKKETKSLQDEEQKLRDDFSVLVKELEKKYNVKW
jgi:hypothetical protein